MYIYIHAYVHHGCAMFIPKKISQQICVCVYIYIYISSCVCVFMHTNTHTHTCTHAHKRHRYATYVKQVCCSICDLGVTHMHVCMCVCIYTYTCICIYMHVHVCAMYTKQENKNAATNALLRCVTISLLQICAIGIIHTPTCAVL